MQDQTPGLRESPGSLVSELKYWVSFCGAVAAVRKVTSVAEFNAMYAISAPSGRLTF